MIINGTFSSNASGVGAGILNLGTLTVTSSTFSGNSGDSGEMRSRAGCADRPQVAASER